MFDFGILCHLLRLMRIYRVGVPRLGIWKVSFSIFFSFLPFLFSSFFPSFSIFPSLSGAPLAPGPLDIVHPCHPVATPLPQGKQICINRYYLLSSIKWACKCPYIRPSLSVDCLWICIKSGNEIYVYGDMYENTECVTIHIRQFQPFWKCYLCDSRRQH